MMDRTILNILFSWKGDITSREFRAGLSVLFLSLSAVVASYTINVMFNTSFNHVEYGEMVQFTYLREILSSITPVLVPLTFILSYSSFAVLMKRMRSYTTNNFLAVLIGVVGFLFFAALFALQKIGMYTIDTLSGNLVEEMLSFLLPTLRYVMSGIAIVGLIVIILLAIPDSKEERPKSFAGLNVTDFALRVGNLMCASAALVVLLIIVYFIFGNSILLLFIYEYWILLTIVGIPHLVLFILFIIYAINRLKNAGKSFWWIAGFLAGFIAATGLVIWGLRLGWNITGLYFAYQLCFSIYLAALCALFLLPTKALKE